MLYMLTVSFLSNLYSHIHFTPQRTQCGSNTKTVNLKQMRGELNPLKKKTQTALFKDPARTSQ
jgi:hypothetical protein